MNKNLITVAVIGVLASPLFAVAADAPASPHSVSYNVGVTSNYLFRGVSQTHGKPAIQGGLDYAHSSGLYAGAWASNVTWVKQFQGSGSTEIDFYGGFKNAFAGDWTYDIGLIRYQYPGHGDKTALLTNPNTTEVYGAIGWKWLTLKYSQAVSQNFIGNIATNGTSNTRGSGYLELNAAYDLGDGWGISGHIAHQKVKNVHAIPGALTDADYTDWNIGVTKDMGYGVVGLLYSDTNTDGSCRTGGGTNYYCWGKRMDTVGHNYRDESKGQLVLNFKKSF